MANIFVSYRSPDRKRVALVVATLRQEGLSVWWDQDKRGQAFAEEIEMQMRTAHAVLALVSPHWQVGAAEGATPAVLHEVGRAEKRLVAARIHQLDRGDLPMPLGAYDPFDLAEWRGDRLDEAWRKLVGRCYELCGKATTELDPSLPPPSSPARAPSPTPGSITIGVHVENGDVHGGIVVNQNTRGN